MDATRWERVHTWGPSLKLEAIARPGGVHQQVQRIRTACGVTIGSRNTFAKLFELDAPPDPSTDPVDAIRARLLVEAIGLEPEEWGVGDVVLPPGYDTHRVLELVGGGGGAERPTVPGGDHAGGDDDEGEPWAASDSNREPAGSLPQAA